MLIFIGLAGATTYTVGADDSLAAKCNIANAGDRIEITGHVSSSDTCGLEKAVTIAGVGGGPWEVPSILIYADGVKVENVLLSAKSETMIGVYDAEVTLDDIEFDGENGSSATYGLYMLGGDVTASNWSIHDHGYASPIYVAGNNATFELTTCEVVANGQVFQFNDYAGPVTAVIDDCDFRDGFDESALGIGISSSGTDLTVRNSTFDNIEGYGGAAIAAYGEGGLLTIEDSMFTNLVTDDEGGALYVTNGTDLVVKGSTFSGNTALRGGAIHVQGSGLTVKDSTFSGNLGTNGGGAIDVFAATEIEIAAASFCENTTELYNGGAHVSIEGSDAHIHHSTFLGGSGTSSASQIWVKSGGNRVTLENNSIIDSSAMGVGATLGASDLTLTNNLFHGHVQALGDNNADPDVIASESGYNAWIGVTNTGDFAPLWELGNEYMDWTDPGYATPQSGCGWLPYLGEGSVLIDAGRPDMEDDDGTRVDIGAFAYEGDIEPPDSDSAPIDSPVDSEPWDSEPPDSEPPVDTELEDDTGAVPELTRYVTGGCRGSLLGAFLIPLGLVLLRRRA
ncbi:MAG: right-handed parallel beta-helix repeat-containing protein [Proteobacteria bacterium]|nr:right-handed parallel beta-helix repeat-containing protein [Pseudomonadota bacterium]